LTVSVFGPSWGMADKVSYTSMEERKKDSGGAGSRKPEASVKWSGEWKLPRLANERPSVPWASGPGVRDLYGRSPNPIKPTSPHVDRRVIGLNRSHGDRKRREDGTNDC